jgi:dipeptidyl aminopeptidase/acylaminoacyl peptidase
MTNWAIGHTRRFKAAVTQRSVVDLVPFFGSSDVGFAFHHTLGAYPWIDPASYQRQSPLTYAPQIRTPLLIIHSENDLRCNIEQAENLFATLKVLRRRVELVRFPEESHGLSRGGRPDRRLVRLEKMLQWFDKYL